MGDISPYPPLHNYATGYDKRATRLRLYTRNCYVCIIIYYVGAFMRLARLA